MISRTSSTFFCDIARPVSRVTAATQWALAGGVFPAVATKLTHCPWFSKPGKLFQPPFLHWSFEVGNGWASVTITEPDAATGGVVPPACALNAAQVVGAAGSFMKNWSSTRSWASPGSSTTIRYTCTLVRRPPITARLPETSRQVTGKVARRRMPRVSMVPAGLSPEGPLTALMLQMIVSRSPLPLVKVPATESCIGACPNAAGTTSIPAATIPMNVTHTLLRKRASPPSVEQCALRTAWPTPAHHASQDLAPGAPPRRCRWSRPLRSRRCACDCPSIEELDAVPGRRRGVAGGDRVNVVRDVGRRILCPLERFLEELLDASGCEGQDHAHRLRALVLEAVHRPTRHIDEVADARGDPFLAEEDAALALDDVERLVLVAMDVGRWAAAGRDDRLHREVRAGCLGAGDEEPV